MRKLQVLALLLLIVLIVGVPVFAAKKNFGHFDVINDSHATITKLYLRSSGAKRWGPELVVLLEPGQAVKLGLVKCGDNDIKVVSSSGQECVIDSVGVCDDDNSVRVGLYCAFLF